MRRHGWAFGLGLFVNSAAIAQPPADSERYPLAPDLPGVVVGQSQYGRPVGKVVAIGGQGEKQVLAEPAPVPKAIERDRETAAPAPADKLAIPAEAMPGYPRPTQGLGLGTGMHLDCVHRLQEWLCFRSRAKAGYYVTPYNYPLQAWFPGDPKQKSFSQFPSVEIPATGKHHHSTTITRQEVVNPSPVVIPPTSEKTMPMPTPKTGLHGPSIRPTAPAGEGDLPPGYQKVNVGLSFTPGVAPISKPTTQTDRVSNWRPK